MRGQRWLFLVVVAFVGCGQANTDPAETARPESSSGGSDELNADDVIARLPEQSEPLVSAEESGLPVTPVSQQSVAEPTNDAFTKLCKAYASGNAEALAQAEKELLALGRETESTLAAALTTGATHERELAAMMLAQIGADSDDARQALKAALKDESPFVRSNAVSALCACGDQSEELIAALSFLLQQEDTDARIMAAMSAANLGGAASDLVPSIVRLLEDSDAKVRGAAAEAVGSIGIDDDATVARLKALASSDEDEAVRTAAGGAIARIGGQPARDGDIVPAGATSESGPNSGQ